jgi:hypothetical protein
MSGMGVPADRLRLSATAQPGLASDEVRVFVR